MVMEFCKVNHSGEIPIETVPDEHEGSRDFKPSFWFGNRRHYLSSFRISSMECSLMGRRSPMKIRFLWSCWEMPPLMYMKKGVQYD